MKDLKMKPKILVIGLDGAEPGLIFDRWTDRLPNLAALMEEGIYGPLTSTIPPLTVPAWAAMLTSKDPGQLGLYGFRNRRDHSYEGLTLASSILLKEKTLDQILSRRRLSSILLGVPLTYPPRPLRGMMVSGCLTPGRESSFTYPEELKPELDRAAGGRYVIDVKGFRTEDKGALLASIHEMTEARFRAAAYLMERRPWDFFMMVEMGTDRINHGFWRYHDPGHRLYQPGHEYEFAIRDYYAMVDGLIGRLVDLAPENTLVAVVSDHGGRALAGGFRLNQWLINQGYLVLKEMPAEPRPLSPDLVDWSRTRVWGEGGYYGRVFLNVAGREPQGLVPSEDYEKMRHEVEARLEAEVDHQGSPLGTRVFRPEEIYHEVKNVAPDLIAYFGDLAWRSIGSVGAGQPIYTFENDTGPDDANHSQEGVIIMAVKGRPLGRRPGPRSGLSLYDVAPTILDHLGLEPPSDMIGRVIE